MRILVTGSSGKLGKVTVAALTRHGHQVRGLDVISGAHTHLVANVKDKGAMLEASRNVDAVIHAAALHGRHMDLNYSREAFVDINIKGTLNLLDACVKNGVSKFQFISTTSVYGKAMVNSDQAVWVDENLIVQPRDIYDITKQACEELCRDFFEKEHLQTTVYRVGRFLPESDNLKLNHRLYRGLDERDGAEALRLALEKDFTQFEIFNISSGTPFQKNDLVALKQDLSSVVEKYFPGIGVKYQRNGWMLPPSIDRVYCCDKAKALFDYQPKYTFEYLLNRL